MYIGLGSIALCERFGVGEIRQHLIFPLLSDNDNGGESESGKIEIEGGGGEIWAGALKQGVQRVPSGPDTGRYNVTHFVLDLREQRDIQIGKAPRHVTSVSHYSILYLLYSTNTVIGWAGCRLWDFGLRLLLEWIEAPMSYCTAYMFLYSHPSLRNVMYDLL